MNDLPSDADMINWIERHKAVVAPHYGTGECAWKAWVLYEEKPQGRCLSVEECAPTWRRAVEAAMQKLP